MIKKVLLVAVFFYVSVQAVTLEEKIGQMFMVGFHGTSAKKNSQICKDIKKYNLGAVILFDYNPELESYDYVMLSGMLNRKFMGNQGAESATDYAYKIIRRMFKTCKKGIAFNLLDARHEWTAKRWDLQSFHPDEIIESVRGFTNKYQLIDGYLENDFTIYAWRQEK